MAGWIGIISSCVSLLELDSALSAVERAGKNPQIKGHVHEELFLRLYNLNPLNWIRDLEAHLSECPNDPFVDIQIKNSAGKSVRRLQLKDCPNSSSSLNRQIPKYVQAGSELLLTPESIKGVRSDLKSNVKSSGISSVDTEKIGRVCNQIATGALLKSAHNYGARLAKITLVSTIAYRVGEALNSQIDNSNLNVPQVLKESLKNSGKAYSTAAVATAVLGTTYNLTKNRTLSLFTGAVAGLATLAIINGDFAEETST